MIRSSDVVAAPLAARPSRAVELELTACDAALEGLPESLDGVTLAHLSDLHRGNGDSDPIIQAAIHRVNALEPDFIALTGDFVDRHARDIAPTAKMLRELRARRGVFAVLGNHDYTADASLMAGALCAAGIHVLTNAAAEVAPGLWIAGVDDLEEGKPDARAALAPVPEGAATILLAHNPNMIERMKADRPLLMLSGHTHGGQFALPLLPPKWICRLHLRTRYVQGWYRRGAMQLYVNRGIGVSGGFPFARRYRCPAEVTLFRFRAKPE